MFWTFYQSGWNKDHEISFDKEYVSSLNQKSLRGQLVTFCCCDYIYVTKRCWLLLHTSSRFRYVIGHRPASARHRRVAAVRSRHRRVAAVLCHLHDEHMIRQTKYVASSVKLSSMYVLQMHFSKGTVNNKNLYDPIRSRFCPIRSPCLCVKQGDKKARFIDNTAPPTHTILLNWGSRF
jgi:hypothetical protein